MRTQQLWAIKYTLKLRWQVTMFFDIARVANGTFKNSGEANSRPQAFFLHINFSNRLFFQAHGRTHFFEAIKLIKSYHVDLFQLWRYVLGRDRSSEPIRVFPKLPIDSIPDLPYRNQSGALSKFDSPVMQDAVATTSSPVPQYSFMFLGKHDRRPWSYIRFHSVLNIPLCQFTSISRSIHCLWENWTRLIRSLSHSWKASLKKTRSEVSPLTGALEAYSTFFSSKHWTKSSYWRGFWPKIMDPTVTNQAMSTHNPQTMNRSFGIFLSEPKSFMNVTKNSFLTSYANQKIAIEETCSGKSQNLFTGRSTILRFSGALVL